MATINGEGEHMLDMQLGKNLGPRAFMVFQRLLRFVPTLNVLSALTGGISVGMLTFPEFHPCITNHSNIALGFFVSSATTSVISVMMSTMLSFQYEGFETASRLDLALLWIPLVLLDWSIVAFLVGILVWYGQSTQGEWRMALVCGQVLGLMVFVIWIAIKMWNEMSVPSGLGGEEIRALGIGVNVAFDARAYSGALVDTATQITPSPTPASTIQVAGRKKSGRTRTGSAEVGKK